MIINFRAGANLNLHNNSYICETLFIVVMKIKALFPGSFDPFTAGHLNILKGH